MKGYICNICEKFVDDPFKVHMREFVMTIDWGDGIASPSKIRHKVHMCGDCYTKFVNYIKYKSLKEKIDEQTERAMPKEDNPVGYHDEHSRILRCSTCNGCDSICDPYCVGSCTTTCPKKATDKEKADEQAEQSMPKDYLSHKCRSCGGCKSACDDCYRSEDICDGCTVDCPKKGNN